MLSVASVWAQPEFNQYFEQGAIRYDYELVGDRNSVEVIPVQQKELPFWGGNPNNLVDNLDRGTYLFQLIDAASGNVIYQMGFCTLFWEWQTTPEANKTKRTFYQSLFFPKPKADAIIIISTRNKKNEWAEIYRDTYNVTNYFVSHEISDIYEIDTIRYSSESSSAIDLVILSEGYTQAELPKFVADSKRLTDSLFAAEPFRKYADKFNVLAVKVPSQESGTDVPGAHIYKNTAFNSNFYTFNSPRYLTCTDMRSIYDALDGVAWDQIYLLVNTDRYGGGGFYNFLNVCTSDNERSPFVFIHEFGHGFGGLGDEYYTPEDTYEEFMDKKIEAWEPNLTTMVDFDKKWGHLIDEGTPIPTPRDSTFLNTVGVFEGGGYEAKGVYSPVMSCWMKEMSAGKFCPVCSESIEQVIKNQIK